MITKLKIFNFSTGVFYYVKTCKANTRNVVSSNEPVSVGEASRYGIEIKYSLVLK